MGCDVFTPYGYGLPALHHSDSVQSISSECSTHGRMFGHELHHQGAASARFVYEFQLQRLLLSTGLWPRLNIPLFFRTQVSKEDVLNILQPFLRRLSHWWSCLHAGIGVRAIFSAPFTPFDSLYFCGVSVTFSCSFLGCSLLPTPQLAAKEQCARSGTLLSVGCRTTLVFRKYIFQVECFFVVIGWHPSPQKLVGSTLLVPQNAEWMCLHP